MYIWLQESPGVWRCRKNSESSRSHLLVGVAVCSIRPGGAPQHEKVQKLATLWLGDLCGSESYDGVQTYPHSERIVLCHAPFILKHDSARDKAPPHVMYMTRKDNFRGVGME